MRINVNNIPDLTTPTKGSQASEGVHRVYDDASNSSKEYNIFPDYGATQVNDLSISVIQKHINNASFKIKSNHGVEYTIEIQKDNTSSSISNSTHFPDTFDALKILKQVIHMIGRNETTRWQPIQKSSITTVKDSSFLQKVRAHIADNLDNDSYQIEDLARHMHLSRIQLYRKLKAITGKTFTQINRTMKVQKAQEMLLNTNRNANEIAYDLGFKDPSHFGKVFKRAVGVSPGEYRNKGMNRQNLRP